MAHFVNNDRSLYYTVIYGRDKETMIKDSIRIIKATQNRYGKPPKAVRIGKTMTNATSVVIPDFLYEALKVEFPQLIVS